jgi:hypothetical protein
MDDLARFGPSRNGLRWRRDERKATGIAVRGVRWIIFGQKRRQGCGDLEGTGTARDANRVKAGERTAGSSKEGALWKGHEE